jgi:hypothetical protein
VLQVVVLEEAEVVLEVMLQEVEQYMRQLLMN